MPYRAGVLVTDAPDILYLEDTDGDGRADVRQVEWTGFGTGSQQLRANSLHWGLDNWIYVANGRCDGDVRRPDTPPEQAIVDPCPRLSISSDFGARRGDSRPITIRPGPRRLGKSFSIVEHDPSAARPAGGSRRERLSGGRGRGGRQHRRAERHGPRLSPSAPPPRQFNTEPANYYNAMCGLTIFTGDALGTSYAGNAFVCESLTNLVTRRQLQPAGPTFVSRRCDNETDREFLASTDNWFHPVNLATGPDGALYVVDFYREFVEHPLYVADEKLRAEVNWRNGAEHGRIWRIRRTDSCVAVRRTPAAVERRKQRRAGGSSRSSRRVVAKYGSAAARGAAGSNGRAATAHAVGRISIATGSIACDVRA